MGYHGQMPTHFREADIWQRLQVSVIVFVVHLFVQQTFCVHGANCSYERENGERERDNILTMNEFKSNEFDRLFVVDISKPWSI
jgi:hypothetical protein